MGTVDRKPYLTSTVLDQDFLDQSQDNLENKLEMIADIETPSGFIRASDRNKYVGGTFYEALMKFPVITRTIGDWLSPTIEFSNLTLIVSNVDGRFNNLLPEGADFDGWIGKDVDVSLGLREVSSTYRAIYKGKVTDVGGFQRDRKSITVISRDEFDQVNQTFPTTALLVSDFPDLDDQLANTTLPVIYGDWETDATTLSPIGASVPAYPVNGKNANVIAGTTDVRCYISQFDNSSLDDANVYLVRSGASYKFASSDITIVSGNRVIDIKQSTITLEDGNSWVYKNGDTFFVRVKGKDLGSYSDNIVWQARDILITHGGLVSGDFNANWATFRDKSSPSNSAISTFKSRVWVQDDQGCVEYTLSMLEQVRLEYFVDNDRKFKMNSLHFDEMPALNDIDFTIKNWDIAEGSFQPKLDDRNVWNRARADYNFDPALNGESRQTAIFKNQAAITQAGKAISKTVVFPNLYVESTVELQIKEMLKLASAYTEFINCDLTWRSVLRDLGDFVKFDIDFSSTKYTNVPGMIRKIGYDPNGIKIPVEIWSFQMTPYDNYNPGYDGTVGGFNATITKET